MKYLFNRRLVPINENYEACSDETVVEIISIHDYDVRYKNEYHHEVLTEGLQNAQYCKADVFRSFIVGTVLVPDKDDLRNSEFSWGFYMHKNHLVLIEDSGRLRNIAEDLPEVRSTENTPAARFFLELLEYFIKDDVIFLQKYEDQLVAIEEDLLEDDIDDFHRDILKCRREILVLNAFYQQLMDMTGMLGENKNYIFNAEDCRLFNVFSNRVERLYDNTQMLREYTVQMREMYQSQIDIHQNQTMKVLTLVTTITAPLALIAGWYGMNFPNMPELHSRYGYLGVIILSIATVIAEIVYFKKKKWFD